VRSTAAPYTESRLTHLVRNKCVGFPVVEQYECKNERTFLKRKINECFPLKILL
jgi:hypothetical protein